MKKLTKSQIDSLAYIMITGSDKGIHTNTRLTLKYDFDVELYVFDIDTCKDVVSPEGVEKLEESKSGIYKAYKWLSNNGFTFEQKPYTKKSMISFINNETGSTAFISTEGNTSSLYVSEKGSYDNREVKF